MATAFFVTILLALALLGYLLYVLRDREHIRDAHRLALARERYLYDEVVEANKLGVALQRLNIGRAEAGDRLVALGNGLENVSA